MATGVLAGAQGPTGAKSVAKRCNARSIQRSTQTLTYATTLAIWVVGSISDRCKALLRGTRVINSLVDACERATIVFRNSKVYCKLYKMGFTLRVIHSPILSVRPGLKQSGTPSYRIMMNSACPGLTGICRNLRFFTNKKYLRNVITLFIRSPCRTKAATRQTIVSCNGPDWLKL
jgi:hypothetical protein